VMPQWGVICGSRATSLSASKSHSQLRPNGTHRCCRIGGRPLSVSPAMSREIPGACQSASTLCFKQHHHTM
jgi:hypothetical protein